MPNGADQRPHCRVCRARMVISKGHLEYPAQVQRLLREEKLALQDVVQFECPQDVRHGLVWHIYSREGILLWAM